MSHQMLQAEPILSHQIHAVLDVTCGIVGRPGTDGGQDSSKTAHHCIVVDGKHVFMVRLSEQHGQTQLADDLEHLVDRLSFAGGFNHYVGLTPAGDFSHCTDDIFPGRIDRVGGAQLLGDLNL